MSEDIKRALTLAGGGLLVAGLLGGGWMWWSEGKRRTALSSDVASWSRSLQAYSDCLTGGTAPSSGSVLLGQAIERSRDVRCYAEHLAGMSRSGDEIAAPFIEAAGALNHEAPATSRLSELDADQTCKELERAAAALKNLAGTIGEPAAVPTTDCSLGLEAWPRISQPPADPDVPGIRKGALREVALRGDRVFAGYRMARQGVLAWKQGEGDWSVVPTALQLDGAYWGGEKPWGVVADPEAPAGMIRSRVVAWSGSTWELGAELPEGMVPAEADGPGGDFAEQGDTWRIVARSLRESAIVLLPVTDRGATVGEPVTLMTVPSGQLPSLHFTDDGTLIGTILTEDPGGFTFRASQLAPGAAAAAEARVFLPVDVPDPLQGETVAVCGDGARRYALAADRWLLRGDGADWSLHHTFEEPLRRAELACHGDSVALLGDRDGAREAAVLYATVCDKAGCPAPEALGEQNATGRGLLFDDDGVRLLASTPGHAIIFHHTDGAAVPERIFSAAEAADDTLPVLSVDGRMFAVRSAE